MRSDRNLLKGTLFGVVFGVLFPVGATLIAANNIPITNLSSLIDLHRQTPLLLIIDTAPLFLGVFAAFGAYQLDRQYKLQDQAHTADELRSLIDTANAPIFGIDTKGLVNEWNQQAEAITGYSKSEVMGEHLVDGFISEDYKEPVQTVLDEALQGLETANYEFPLYSKTNARIDVLLNSTTRRDAQGRVVGVVGVGQDVTDLTKIQQEQMSKANDLSRLIATANAPIFGTDSEGRINEWNQMAEKITGFTKAAVLGVDLVQGLIPEHSRSSVQAVFDQTLQGHETANYPLTLTDKNGVDVDVLLNSTAQRDNSGAIVGVVGIGQDVTELNSARKEFERKLELAANQDVLTGLPNRRYFQDYLQKQLTVHKDTDAIGGLLFLDLDRFKLVNDSLGHSAGDQLLKIIAKRLLASVRTDDLVCRLGGDEFVVLLSFESVTSAQAIENTNKIATKITGVLNQQAHVKDHLLTVNGSIGVCFFTATDSVEEIVKRADNAMYLAKGDTTSNIAFYTDAVHQQLTHQMQVLEGITEGLATDHFFMHYQPQFNHLQELIGVEALVRWQHPQLGLLMPDQFIDLAEKYQRINAVGAWVIESVLSQVAQWRQAGYVLPKVAINISPIQLLDENFSTIVNALREQYGINPEGIVFEITESADIEHFNLISTVLMALKAQGYRFSLDDFGTGYASMTHFKRLPFSQVKIDKSFIDDMDSNEDSLAIVEVVLAMARSLKLEVVAEGVETQAQLDILNKLGCTGYQGYLFAKPLGVQAVTSLLRSRIE